MPRRARLGITVNLRARESDSVGAFVSGVSPGGPAAQAGVLTGDIIVRLNGESLVVPGRRVSREESAPGIRLLELTARLEPNDTVALELRRARERKTVRVVTAEDPTMGLAGPDESPFLFQQFDGDDSGRTILRVPGRFKVGPDSVRVERGWMVPGPEGVVRTFSFAFGSPLAELELAPLNPDLGRYFGTTNGVLVINAPPDSKLGLKGGDVVLSVDGRPATSPPQLLRVLRSYDDGESFKLEIMRERKRLTVTGTTSAGEGRDH
jgi:S1-C subfamily serine protease